MAGLTTKVTHHGVGVFTTKARNRGEEVVKLFGPIIDSSAAIAKGEKERDPLQNGENSYIDLEEPMRSVSHSCNPSCGVRDGNRLITLRDLAPGEEITFDYSTTMDEDRWTMECTCGAFECRGVVKDFVTLPDDVKARYFRLRVVMPFIETKYKPQYRPE